VEHEGGPRRLITLFVYLNTLPELPENGGCTEFPLVSAGGLAVRPRCGAALLFCNVLPDGSPDARVSHRACPVPPGHFKFGANIWINDVTMQMHVVAGAGCTSPLPPRP